jgi:hypothetical protein
MTHCHIAEHLESHMMFAFYVQTKGAKPEAHHRHQHQG